MRNFALAILATISTAPVNVEAGKPSIRRIRSSNDHGFSSAVVVDGLPLVHTTQLLPGFAGRESDATLTGQLESCLTQIESKLRISRATRRDVVKLNCYVADAAVRDVVRQRLTQWFGPSALPAVSYVATPLPDPKAKVAIDAVFAARAFADQDWAELTFLRPGGLRVLPPGDVVYISGQARPGDLATATRDTLRGLLRTLSHLGLDRANIIQIKCFLQPMKDVQIVEDVIRDVLRRTPRPPTSHVEWISGSLPIEIELVAYAPAARNDDTVSFITPPWMKSSPVFSRVSRIHGDRRIYVSGLYSAMDGTGESQVRNIFSSLKRTLILAGSDIRHLAKATYYVSDSDASAQLNQIRPTVYDPARPPAASKALVKDVAFTGRTVTLDMIAAPSQGTPKPGQSQAPETKPL